MGLDWEKITGTSSKGLDTRKLTFTEMITTNEPVQCVHNPMGMREACIVII